MFTQRLTHKCSYKIYIIAKKLGKKDSRCPSADDWINKLLYIHSMAHLLLFFFLSLISFLIILQYISFCSCFKVIADSIIFVNSVLFLLSDFFFLFVGEKVLLLHMCSKFLLDAELWEFYIVDYWIFLNFSEWRALF